MGIYLSTVLRNLTRVFKSDSASSIIVVGLANAGKSSLVKILKDADDLEIRTEPTIGHVVETINYKNLISLHIWDLGGQDRLRFLWQRYYLTAEAVVFVVDSSETERFPEAVDELEGLLRDDELRIVPVLVLANKQDVVTGKPDDVVKMFDLAHLSARPLKVFPCSIKKNEGIDEAMKWLIESLKKMALK